MNVKNINQNKLIKFIQGQPTNAVKRHLNALQNRKNTAQKKAYINAQLENLFTRRGTNSNSLEHKNLNKIVSSLQKSGLVINKNFTRNQLVKNSNRIGLLSKKLQNLQLYKNPYLRLLFTKTNNVQRALNKNNTGNALKKMVQNAQQAQQAFMARQFIGSSRIPQTSIGQVFQQSINLNKKIRNYFKLQPNANLRYVTSKPDFVKFLNKRGPMKNGDTLNNVHREYVRKNFNRILT
jgi:hypothetical protein